MTRTTKELILDAAENLFANSGFQATSMRDITGAAGVNLASINYHFGSKEALLTALVERHFAPVNRRRIELLDELEARPVGAVKLEDLVRAFLSPPFELFASNTKKRTTLLRLVGRLHSEPDEIRAAFTVALQPTLLRFVINPGNCNFMETPLCYLRSNVSGRSSSSMVASPRPM